MARHKKQKKPKNELEQYFLAVYKKHIRLEISEQYMNNNIIRLLHSRLLQYLKRDRLFSIMYKKTFFGGSYFDGLKVSKPDEYDINFQLEIPAHVKVISGRLLGYAQVEVLSQDPKQLNEIRPLMGKYNNLAVSGVNSWFQGIVNKAVTDMKNKKLKKEQLYKIISVISNGPAMTIVVENGRGEEISIDFVPAFWFSSDDWPENCIKEPPGMDYGFCVVPKTTKDQTEQNDSNFRLSFQEQERELIKNRFFLKPAIKLIKYLRDEETQTPLKSYFIKTVAMWELKDSGDFTRAGMSAPFMHMLKRLQSYIKSGEIPFYWNPNGLDLTSDFTPQFRENLSNRLARIIRNIEELNFEQMSKYFNM